MDGEHIGLRSRDNAPNRRTGTDASRGLAVAEGNLDCDSTTGVREARAYPVGGCPAELCGRALEFATRPGCGGRIFGLAHIPFSGRTRPGGILACVQPGYCPQCGERVTPFAAGCALCGADLDPKRWQGPVPIGKRFSIHLPARWRRALLVREAKAPTRSSR
jgi:hypothetical protein